MEMTPDHAGHAAAGAAHPVAAPTATDPVHYITGAHRKAAGDAPAGARFTCPMHPEIVRDGPGDCPIIDDLAGGPHAS